MNVLVVEDEPAVQELIAVNLEHGGHRVRLADDAETALRMVKAELPGLPAEPTSLVATAAGTSIADSVSPLPGEPILYRVFGAGSCTGRSYEP